MPPILSALGLLAAVLLVLAGAYVFTRWAGRGLGFAPGGAGGRGRLQALDRLALGRDQAILVIRAGERYLLLGSTPTGITLLTELSREEGERWTAPPAGGAAERKTPDFLALMQRLREKNEK